MDATIASLVSSSSRAAQLRMRPDLVVLKQSYQGREYWVIKDPLVLKYYRFEEEEFFLLNMLDGMASPDYMIRRFESRFAPQKISLQELHQFTGTLYRSGLVISDAPDQGRSLQERRDKTRRRERLAALTNIMSIRFKGFDPDRLLTWLSGKVSWFFSTPVMIFCLLLVASALLLVLVQFDLFRARLPAFQEFFAAKNWLWLAVTLGLTKVLHEFGHGLTCKRFGGECHEMGVMILVMTPCLYCNVSDSWMIPSKWRRAAIGAAGMYVEIVLASVCTFIWWFTQPGMLNYLCLNVMFVSSISTILFNANPLLRYDGYYILSDLIEIPNLRQKATTLLNRKMGKWLLGLPEAHDPFLPQRRLWMLIGFAVAAAAYRWVITLSIFWFVYNVLEPYGLKIVGQLLACMALWGLLVMPVWQLGKFFYVPGRIDRVKKPRMATSIAVIGSVLIGVLLIPLPFRIHCTLQLQPRGASSVYIQTPGEIRAIHVQPGQQVAAGDPLLELKNIDAHLAVEQLAGERDQLAVQLVSLQQRALSDPAAGEQISQTSESLTALDQRLKERRDELQELTIVAPTAGWIVPPPSQPRSSDRDELPSWSDTPLKTTNVGAFMTEGVLVCQVGDPRHLEAVLAIDQNDIEFVISGQRVDFLLDQFPTRRFHSKIQHVSRDEMKFIPRNLAGRAGESLPTTTDANGRQRPLNTTYQASSPLNDPDGLIVSGAVGNARIHAGWRSIGSRLWRYLSHTFNFEM